MPRSTASASAPARWRARYRALIRSEAGFAAIALVALLVGLGLALRGHATPAGAAGSPFSVLKQPVPQLRSLGITRPDLAHAHYVAAVEQPVALRATLGGRPVASLGDYTEFGSPQVLALVAWRPGWLGVISTKRPNGAMGWIRATHAAIVRDPYTVDVNLGQRELHVYSDGRLVRRAKVAVGANGTPTPTGRFSVTDKLLTHGPSPYGCCALALSGHQPNLMPGWIGGDRIAIHATEEPGTIGYAASLGCLRVAEADARWLVANVMLGTVVTID